MEFGERNLVTDTSGTKILRALRKRRRRAKDNDFPRPEWHPLKADRMCYARPTPYSPRLFSFLTLSLLFSFLSSRIKGKVYNGECVVSTTLIPLVSRGSRHEETKDMEGGRGSTLNLLPRQHSTHTTQVSRSMQDLRPCHSFTALTPPCKNRSYPTLPHRVQRG